MLYFVYRHLSHHSHAPLFSTFIQHTFHLEQKHSQSKQAKRIVLSTLANQNLHSVVRGFQSIIIVLKHPTLAQKLDTLSMIDYMVAPSAAIATAIPTVQAKPLVAAPLEAAVAKSAYFQYQIEQVWLYTKLQVLHDGLLTGILVKYSGNACQQHMVLSGQLCWCPTNLLPHSSWSWYTSCPLLFEAMMA